MLHHREFQPEPESTAAVRRFVADALTGTSRLDDIVLTASELASNAVRHAQTPYTVRLMQHQKRIRLEVSDGSSTVPTLDGLPDSHRGLRIVNAAADEWGVDVGQDGKTTWTEFNTPG